jgi:hypothetical protein
VDFQKLIKEMKLPPRVTLNHPDYFEGEEFQIKLGFKNASEYRDQLEILKKLWDEEYISKIMSLLP